MPTTYSPRQLLAIVRTLADGLPISGAIPAPKCYPHHRAHWEGWLRDYCEGRAFYGRKSFDVDAATIYNRIQNVGMLIWLAEAAGCPPGPVRQAALRAEAVGGRVANQCGAVRKVLPWPMVAKSLWP